MSRSNVLEISQILATDQASAPGLLHSYSDLVQDLARQTTLLVEFTLEPLTTSATYNWPSRAGKILAWYWNGRELPVLTSDMAVTIYGPNWATHRDDPEAIIMDRDSERTYRPYPRSERVSLDSIPVYGEPLGRDFPLDSLVILHTYSEIDFPDFLDLPLALLTLAREMSMDSPHSDKSFAEALVTLGARLLKGISG